MHDQRRLAFPLLVDAHNRLARQFGVVYRVLEEQQALYRSTFVNLPCANGDPAGAPGKSGATSVKRWASRPVVMKKIRGAAPAERSQGTRPPWLSALSNQNNSMGAV